MTTTLENASHGTDSQATMLTRQIHRTAAKEGRLPNCLYIGADNTPKETKNTTVICWAIFLLASLRDTALSAIEFPVPACRAHPRIARPVLFTFDHCLTRQNVLHNGGDGGHIDFMSQGRQGQLVSPRIHLQFCSSQKALWH